MTDDKTADLLGGGGAATAKFLTKKTTHEGVILEYEKTHQRDIKTGKPVTWDDGNPKYQWVFTVQTNEHDSDIEDDDGQRRIFAKAAMLGAIRKAIKDTGHDGDLVGGTLKVQYVDDGEPSAAGFNPPKQYRAKFTPPTQTSELADEPEDDDEAPF